MDGVVFISFQKSVSFFELDNFALLPSLTPRPDLSRGDVRAQQVILLDHEVGSARGDGPGGNSIVNVLA